MNIKIEVTLITRNKESEGEFKRARWPSSFGITFKNVHKTQLLMGTCFYYRYYPVKIIHDHGTFL